MYSCWLCVFEIGFVLTFETSFFDLLIVVAYQQKAPHRRLAERSHSEIWIVHTFGFWLLDRQVRPIEGPGNIWCPIQVATFQKSIANIVAHP